eukprot:10844416-Alexandrium_andersonii.AAC.1
MFSLPVEVVDAVVHRAHGWRKARNPSHTVAAALRRHHAVMPGSYARDGRSSWWFACQPGVDLS